MTSKYCVINYESYYNTQRLLLNIGSILVILFTVLGFPFFFVELYQPVIDKLNDDRGSEYWRFIAWSVVIVSFFVNILIFINNGFVLGIFHNQYGSTLLAILIFLIVFSVLCYGVWIINFLSCVVAIWYLKFYDIFSKDLPLPRLLNKFCTPDNSNSQATAEQGNPRATAEQDGPRATAEQGSPRATAEQGSPQANAEQGNPERSAGTCCCGGYSKKRCCPYSIVIALGYTIVVHFLQLLSFHVVYIILGAIASPSVTLSVLCNYVTAYLFAVVYISVILKYMDKVYFKKYVSLNFIFCILPLFSGGLLLIVSVACFTALFYRFTVAMDYTSQNEGILGVVKSIFPSILVTVLSFIGNKILVHIQKSSRSEKNSRSSTETPLGHNQRGPADSGYHGNPSNSVTSETSSSSSQEVSVANGRIANTLRISDEATPSRPGMNHFPAGSTAGSTRKAGAGSSEEKKQLITTAEVEQEGEEM